MSSSQLRDAGGWNIDKKVPFIATQFAFTYSKLTIGTLEQGAKYVKRHWRRSGGFIVNFEYITHLVLVLLFFNFENVIADWVNQFYIKNPSYITKMIFTNEIAWLFDHWWYSMTMIMTIFHDNILTWLVFLNLLLLDSTQRNKSVTIIQLYMVRHAQPQALLLWLSRCTFLSCEGWSETEDSSRW